MSTVDLISEDKCQWPDTAPLCLDEETQFMLGGPWEDISHFEQPTTRRRSASLTHEKPLGRGNLNATSICSSCSCEGGVSATQLSEPDYCNSSQQSNGTSTHSLNLNHEIEVASKHTEQALDDYLECYSQAHSSLEELFHELRGGLQKSDQTNAIPHDLPQGISEARNMLMSQANVVKEAQLKRMALRSAMQEQDRCTRFDCVQCLEAEAVFDDDDSTSDVYSPSTIPIVVGEYFRIAGEAYIENERLVDLEHEHEAQLAAFDCGENMDECIADTESTYQRKRQELGLTLAILHYRLHAQRDACVAQGFDPERYRYRRFSSHQR